MADRVPHAAWAKPGRHFGFGAGLAAVLVVALALPASGLTTPSSAARTIRASSPTAGQQSISAKVTALLGRMTVAEKFGQLEMAGPDGPNGTPGDLLTEAKNGQIGSVLDLVGVSQHQPGPAAGAGLTARNPADLRARRHPRLQDDVPGAPRRSQQLGPRTGRERRVRVGLGGHRGRHQVDVQPDGRHQPRSALGPRRRGRGRGSVSGLRDRRREGSRLPGLRLQRPGQDGGDRQALRGLWRPGRRPGVQHGRHVHPAAVQRLPAALQGGGRRRRRDGDGLVQLAQRRAQHRQSVHADDDPARRMGLRRHDHQ